MESQLSFVADGMRIKISLSPKTSAVQIDLLMGFAVYCTCGGTFPSSIEGNTERLLGPGEKATDCVTVTVRVCVFTDKDVEVEEILGIGEESVVVGVDEIETADMTLLFTEIAGVELTW